MNTKDEWKTTVKILDELRRELWIQIFPDAVVPIKSIFPSKVNVPGHKHADAYMLDLAALSDAQREGVITLLAFKFGEELEDVEREIDAGVPILADGVVVGTTDQGLFFSMIDVEDRGNAIDNQEDDDWWSKDLEDE